MANKLAIQVIWYVTLELQNICYQDKPREFEIKLHFNSKIISLENTLHSSKTHSCDVQYSYVLGVAGSVPSIGNRIS